MKRPPFDPSRVVVPPEDRVRETSTPVLTVTQVTHAVKRAIEEHLPRTIRVIGEISNFKRHTSGHLYFTLKDERSELSCVMWRSDVKSLKFDVTDGLEVIATGGIDVFERAGRYQLYVRRLEPKGVGALELAFRQLCEKLEAEGLFEAKHKKPLPRYPQRIAVVTSATSAAVCDILQTLRRRFGCAEVLVYPVTVQGPTAAGEIAAAIQRLNAQSASLGGVDVIITGRGGGSLEDLWAFNEEIVARAIFASEIPVVSAVGHEVDVSISDLVADVRAATPTAAAELVTPDRGELLADLEDKSRHLRWLVAHTVELRRSALTGLLQRRWFREPLTIVQGQEQVVDEILSRLQRITTDRLHRLQRGIGAAEMVLQRIRPDVYNARMQRALDGAGHRLRWSLSRRMLAGERLLATRLQRLATVEPARAIVRHRERIDSLVSRLEGTSYRRTLQRGFTITRTKKGRKTVRESAMVADGDLVITETTDGEFESRVVNRKQMELFD